MTDIIYQIDKTLFYFFNNTISNSLFDRLFPFITEVKHWYIAYIILILILFFKGGRLGKIAAIMTILLITVSDQLSSSLLKNLFARVRPCNELPDVNVLVFCSGSYSMPSSHAVNNFTVAAYFSNLYPKFKWILYSVAALIAISRPYVGVHYPSDIFVGGLIGIILGLLFAFLTKFIDSLISKRFITAKTID
ncbi:MAG: phosphatase PAP2 family protein [Bacteroidetes bacterium]|nr:phosphatase PAP2 family protein [Bacteroidota bacterium]